MCVRWCCTTKYSFKVANSSAVCSKNLLSFKDSINSFVLIQIRTISLSTSCNIFFIDHLSHTTDQKRSYIKLIRLQGKNYLNKEEAIIVLNEIYLFYWAFLSLRLIIIQKGKFVFFFLEGCMHKRQVLSWRAVLLKLLAKNSPFDYCNFKNN